MVAPQLATVDVTLNAFYWYPLSPAAEKGFTERVEHSSTFQRNTFAKII